MSSKRNGLREKRLKVTATEAKVNLNAEIDSIVAEAKKTNEGAPAKSKSERVSNIRGNRAAERSIMQNDETSESKTLALSQNKSEEDMSPILRMIKAKAEEKLKND
jgi:hypothetical protein